MLTRNLAVMPVMAREIKRLLQEGAPSRDRDDAYTVLSDVKVIRRGKQPISIKEWYFQELQEFKEAAELLKVLEPLTTDPDVYYQNALEFFDVIGLIARFGDETDLDWLVPENEEEYEDRELINRILAVALDDLVRAIGDERLFAQLIKNLNLDRFYSWYDEKSMKNYDMSVAWVPKVAVLVSVISLIPHCK